MSIATTHLVTREFAIQAILIKVMSATNEQLESMLESAIHNGFYNFTIVTQDAINANENQQYPQASLYDLGNLPEYNDAY